MKTFSHLVEIDEKTRKLSVFRMFPNGERQLFTAVDLPERPRDGSNPPLDDFARQLGENILLDSPVARKLLSL